MKSTRLDNKVYYKPASRQPGALPFLIIDPFKDTESQDDNSAEKLSVILGEGCAVIVLLLGVLPVILLSVFMVRQSIIFFVIGVPVLILWIISVIVALIPGESSRDSGK